MVELYIFLDESGNFVFSHKGTQYLVFCAVTMSDIFPLMNDLNLLKHRLIREGYDIEYFHASEDRQAIRNRVFDILEKATGYEVDSVIVEKAKTNPSLRDSPKLYVRVYEWLLKYVLYRHEFEKIVVFTDTIPHMKKREAMKKGLKEAIRKIVGRDRPFHILHHSSKSHFCLQAADYCCWAIYRKWGNWGGVEMRPYGKIKQKVSSEFDIFERGATLYYNK